MGAERAAGGVTAAQTGTATPRQFAPGRLLVAPAEHAAAGELGVVHRRLRTRVEHVVPGTRVRSVRVPPGLSVAEAAVRYERSGLVRFAEPDYVVRPTRVPPVMPDDPDFARLYGMHNTGQTGGSPDADIDMPEAWALTTGTRGPVIAVLDTGVDIDHPDLTDNVWTNPGEIAGNRIDDDSNGFVDDVHGWDFVNDDNSVIDSVVDDLHGTHVAGTIAASGDNGVGVTGVAWRARLMPVKFIGPGRLGYVSDAIAALDYAVDNGARISNNSWGLEGSPSQALEEAIERASVAGHLVVAAAGNRGRDADVEPVYPAAFTGSNIISVAASDHRDLLAPYSNFGSRSVDLAAPGDRIFSTLPGHDYGYSDGTSMATPHVAGAAALVWARRPALTLATVKNRLLGGVDRSPALVSTVSGGRLNVRRALGPATATRLTLTRAPAVITHGGRTRLRGKLSASGGALVGRRIVIQQRPLGVRRWRALPGGARVTARDGAFVKAGLRPTKHTDYRARYAGELPSTAGDWSPTRRTWVRVKVSLAVATRDLELGRSRMITGAVAPPHRGRVRLVVARDGQVVARRNVRLVDSRYQCTFRPGRLGRFRVYAVRAADRDHLRGRSPGRSFRVVR
jgi:thermitase